MRWEFPINTHLALQRSLVPERDDESDDRPYANGNHADGVDDGLLGGDAEETQPTPRRGGGNGGKPPLPERRPSFAFPGYYGNGFATIDGVETPIPDVNAYQHKKTLAQGMMDLALLSANANQLRYVLETGRMHPYFYPSLLFISLSIILQVSDVAAHRGGTKFGHIKIYLGNICDSLLLFAGCSRRWTYMEWQIQYQERRGNLSRK